jgi:hypothetical protein
MTRTDKVLDAKALDARCMEQFGYAPPFTGYWGTEP